MPKFARPIRSPLTGLAGLLAGALLLPALSGCAAVTNPVVDGIPVRKLPEEYLGRPRENDETIPLNLLRQSPPEIYRLEPGDILGIYIEGVLGEPGQVPPVRYPEQSSLPPALGFPIPVREDGTLPLPLVDPVRVQGMSLTEATEAVRQAYTVKKQILKSGRERIIVTLMEPRRYSVLVVRQDSAGGMGAVQPVQFTSGISSRAGEIVGPRKRGTGVQLELPAYENDVLNALTRSGGLPGLDAKNEVTILRGTRSRTGAGRKAAPCLPGDLAAAQQGADEIIRIPLRLPPGVEAPVRPEDIILKTGDIVFIESRDSEVFYAGGLLQNGQYPLPRDYDLDVVQAIAILGGPLVNGAFNLNNFSGNTQQSGIGFPNPSLVNILRTIPGKGQINIRVDLNRALRDPRERVLIQPKDMIILQSTPGEAFAQYFTNVFQLDFLGTILRHRDAIATTAITAP